VLITYGRTIALTTSVMVIVCSILAPADLEARQICFDCYGNGQVCVKTSMYQCPEGCVIQECWFANDCSNCQVCDTCYYHGRYCWCPSYGHYIHVQSCWSYCCHPCLHGGSKWEPGSLLS
jgi:hypothetical protein